MGKRHYPSCRNYMPSIQLVYVPSSQRVAALLVCLVVLHVQLSRVSTRWREVWHQAYLLCMSPTRHHHHHRHSRRTSHPSLRLALLYALALRASPHPDVLVLQEPPRLTAAVVVALPLLTSPDQQQQL